MLDFHVPYNHKFCFINIHGQFVRLAPFIDFLQCFFFAFSVTPEGFSSLQINSVSSAYINAELSGSIVENIVNIENENKRTEYGSLSSTICDLFEWKVKSIYCSHLLTRCHIHCDVF